MGFLSRIFGTSHGPSRSETRQAEDVERDKQRERRAHGEVIAEPEDEQRDERPAAV